MKHRQYYVEQLAASGRDLPLVGGDLMVVRYPENPNLDWELIVRTRANEALDQAPYRLLISGPEGSFTGDAVLVRSDGRAHVFRGAGDLGGFDEGDFA
ncbi:MAG: hypothetical protein R2710_05065 [Acidimicrobiales bacterium]